MHTVTHTFSPCKATASYGCTCSKCGKALRRKVTAEHTVNPFNKNPDGTPRTRPEVYREAQAEADRKAAAMEGSQVVCRSCEEAPVIALLRQMFSNPDASVPSPDPFRGSAMETLHDRGFVQEHRPRCECGAPCCRGYLKPDGYRLTWEGKKRAEKLPDLDVHEEREQGRAG
jgi:hypothetical protein